jgi:very-short-patch-repair endonuclease
MFLSMVIAPNDVGTALTRDTFAHRFNVAASRARDRMYLVRSIELDHLSEKDVLRRSLIGHFTKPFAQDPEAVADLRARCESPFEREVYDELTRRGFRVRPQVKVGAFRIDLVVEGTNDARLAVECDGDQYHGADRWSHDMQRQRVLERAGWIFWRCFASAFVRRREEVVRDLLETLQNLGISPTSGSEGARSVHCESRRVRTEEQKLTESLELTISGNASGANNDVGRTADHRALAAPRVLLSPQRAEESAGPGSAVAAQPAQRPSPEGDSALIAVLDQHRLRSVDNRANGGALWIALRAETGEAAKQLSSLGFRFKPGRGWWRK